MELDNILIPIPLKEKEDEKEEDKTEAMRVHPAPAPDAIDKWVVTCKHRIGRAVATIQGITALADREELDWPVVPGDERVRMRESGNTILVDAIVQGRAERYAYAARDYQDETRLQWDTGVLVHVEQRESYHVDDGYKLHWVASRTKSPVLFGVKDRFVQGVLLHWYAAQSRTHYVVFGSLAPPCGGGERVKPPPDACPVTTDVTTAVVVRQLDERVRGVRECQLLLVYQYANLHDACIGSVGPVAAMYEGRVREQLRARALLYQDAVLRWNDIYGKRKRTAYKPETPPASDDK